MSFRQQHNTTMKLTLWIFILLATCPLYETSKSALRIYKGQPEQEGRFPYIVSMIDNYKNYLIRVCTGSLIRREYVLTAGHCLSDKLEFVQFDEMNIAPSRSTKKRRVLEMLRQPNYYKTKKSLWLNDIGVVRVNPIEVRTYGHLAPVNFILTIGHPVTLAGFGKNLRDNNTFEQRNIRQLLTGEGILTECVNEIKVKIPEGFHMNYLCVDPQFNRMNHIMSGDAGGPLLYDDQIIGVASQVYLRKGVSVYTSINRQLLWIRQVIFHEKPQS